ncbi:hypothetical protein [uncultured Algibacter sp.]|uniref:hypothetical protein n=1 Tax=uncultured Algibacter sp. TaxID=298659 RepID=UPI00321647FF
MSCKKTDDNFQKTNFKIVRSDSVYDIAKNNNLADSIKFKSANLLYKIAVKENQDSFIYKSLMLKTIFHSKFKEIDSALFYSKSIIALGKMHSNYDYLVSGLKKAALYSAKKSDYKKSIFYSHKLLNNAIEKADSSTMAFTYLKLGRYFRKDDQLQKSFNSYTKSFDLYKKIGDSINLAKSLLEMSKIQKNLGDFIGSRITAIDGLKYLENQDNRVTIFGLYQTITTAYREEGNFDNALKNNNKALDLLPSNKIKRILENTKANILGDQGNYKVAIVIFNNLKNQIDSITNKTEYARVINNLGYVEWLKNSDNDISEYLLHTALVIRKETKDIRGLISSNIRLTEYYENRSPKKAHGFAKEALLNATKINDQISQLESLGYIIKLKDNPKEEALLYTKIDKKLTKINQQNRELYSSTKYNNEKLLKDNSIIKADRLKKQKLNNWYLFGLITAILTIVLIVIILKNRHTKVQQQKVLETEKRISKRIHDELANDVYSSMVQLENNTASIAEVVDNLEDIYHKARDLSQEKTTIRSNKEFIDDLKKTLASFKTEDTNVIVQSLIADIWIDISNEKKLIVDRVIKELLVNMRKHSNASLVSVIFSRKNNIIKIGYTDNGIGTYKNKISKGVGLVNAENRIEAIGGSFIFDKSITNGFKISIEIPV